MKPVRIALVLAVLSATPVFAQSAPRVDVFKRVTCGCCSAWVDHLRKNGFEVQAHDVSDVPAVRQKLGMPDRVGSCHTAKVGGYVIEGHVPAADIHRLLKEKSRTLGLAVPSMPPGSPGMESPRPIPFDTLLVARDGGSRVFASH